MSDIPSWQRSFVQALILATGIDPREKADDGKNNLRMNYKEGNSRTSIALVKQRIALAFTNDEVDEMEEEGWAIIRFPTRDLESFGTIMSSILDVRRELKKSEMTTPKQTSKAEELLINKLISGKYNLPVPERDYTFKNEKNGREITVPDLAWPKYRLCVYVDGGWWHHGKDVIDSLNMDKKEERQIAQRVTKRNESDANKRRYIQAKLDWRYIECSAEKLVESDKYLTNVADDVYELYMRLRNTQESEKKYGSTENISDIL